VQTVGYQVPTHRTVLQDRLWDVIKVVELEGTKNEFKGYEKITQTVSEPPRETVVKVEIEKPVEVFN